MNNFDELLEKINYIENNSNNNSDIIEKTLIILKNKYNVDNSLIIKFKDLHNLNKKFFTKHSKKNIKYKKDLFCSLCQDNILSKHHKIYLDKCSHCFHKKCLNKYFKFIKMNFSCPLCKVSYKDSLCNIIKKITYETL